MPNFTLYTNEQILQYLVENFHEMEAGEPPANMVPSFLSGLNRGGLVIERRGHAFAIVNRANGKGVTVLGVELPVPPESDLKILMVSREHRGNGLGPILLAEVMEKYMDDQAMTLVCAGDGRKALFEDAGFLVQGRTPEGLYEMLCPARVRT